MKINGKRRGDIHHPNRADPQAEKENQRSRDVDVEVENPRIPQDRRTREIHQGDDDLQPRLLQRHVLDLAA